MRSIILAAALLLPITAHAQSLQQQVDTAISQITRAAAGLSNQIGADQAQAAQLQQQIATLNKQVADLTKERDDLKAAPKP